MDTNNIKNRNCKCPKNYLLPIQFPEIDSHKD